MSRPRTRSPGAAAGGADPSSRRLQQELDAWQSSVVFSNSRTVVDSRGYDDAADTPFAARQQQQQQQQPPPRPSSSAPAADARVSVTFVDESRQLERNLGTLVAPPTTSAGGVALADILHLIALPDDANCAVRDCTLCLMRVGAAEHEVIEFADAPITFVHDGDTLFIARMEDTEF
jgi:hypothetical protein